MGHSKQSISQSANQFGNTNNSAELNSLREKYVGLQISRDGFEVVLDPTDFCVKMPLFSLVLLKYPRRTVSKLSAFCCYSCRILAGKLRAIFPLLFSLRRQCETGRCRGWQYCSIGSHVWERL